MGVILRDTVGAVIAGFLGAMVVLSAGELYKRMR